MQEPPKHSDYYNSIKTRYDGTDPEKALVILCREMLPHIETLQSSLHHIQRLDTSATQDLFEDYSAIVSGLVKRVNQIEKLRAEALYDNNLSPTEALVAFHYSIDSPLAYIRMFAEFFPKETSEKPAPGLPEEYRHWVANMREAANRMWDLLEVFTGVRIQEWQKEHYNSG